MTDPIIERPGASSAATGGGASSYSDAGQAREPSEVSVGQLMSDISRDMSTLIRQEVALAKAELRQEGSKAGKAAGMLGGAGLAGYFLLLFLSLALARALFEPLGNGWSHLLVGALWGLLAAALFVLGRQKMRQVNKPEQTMETVSEIPPALKPNS